MIKVLIVEDSYLMQELLMYIINSDPAFRVIGVAANGEEAIKAVQELHPDIITMDIHMPKVDGIEATRQIMENYPTPIIIVSGSNQTKEVAYSFRLLEAGALAVLLRPPGIGHPNHKSESRKMIQTLKLMSEIKVVRRSSQIAKEPVQQSSVVVKSVPKASSASQIIVIGASTGGPPVLQKILAGLPKDFPVPLLIVQHIAPGFVEGFVEWLSKASNFPVQVAIRGEKLLPGHAYVAPDGFHTGVDTNFRIVLSDHAPENGLRPSVAYLFRTVAQVYDNKATGILLTGMGKDGAEELKGMKDSGAVTIAQDFESSVVHGMPGEAIKLDAARYVFSPENIVRYLAAMNKNGK